ncbi:MAG: nucleoside monophosphate kinase [Candidatus Saccharimonadales bacterium]
MIVFFGPAGAGKSVQGQMLAARMNWRWLSAGQLLRDTHDPAIIEHLQTGKLVPNDMIQRIMGEALKRAETVNHVILDGFPRMLDQAKWLIDSQPEHGRAVNVIVVLEVPREELLKRLEVRGRADDTPEAIDERLNIYRQEIYPILNYFTEQHIPIAHIDGMGSVGQIHDRIAKEITSRGIA